MPAPIRGKPAQIAPVVAVPRGERRPAATMQQTNHFQIVQQPGESAEALADRIAQRLKDKDAVSRRGSLVDAA